ncbi:hypothetical protein J6590_105429 [Homalodisca vitripennis]|nr:hypothetical protein J6590_105429 [Homalodisca vitripennis]
MNCHSKLNSRLERIQARSQYRSQEQNNVTHIFKKAKNNEELNDGISCDIVARQMKERGGRLGRGEGSWIRPYVFVLNPNFMACLRILCVERNTLTDITIVPYLADTEQQE